jgi:hypothetical protein
VITQEILGGEYRSLSYNLCSFIHSPLTSSFLGPNNITNTIVSTPSAYIPLSMSATIFHTNRPQQENRSSVYFNLELQPGRRKILHRVIASIPSIPPALNFSLYRIIILQGFPQTFQIVHHFKGAIIRLYIFTSLRILT